jgi:hypothetical protein
MLKQIHDSLLKVTLSKVRPRSYCTTNAVNAVYQDKRTFPDLPIDSILQTASLGEDTTSLGMRKPSDAVRYTFKQSFMPNGGMRTPTIMKPAKKPFKRDCSGKKRHQEVQQFASLRKSQETHEGLL